MKYIDSTTVCTWLGSHFFVVVTMIISSAYTNVQSHRSNWGSVFHSRKFNISWSFNQLFFQEVSHVQNWRRCQREPDMGVDLINRETMTWPEPNQELDPQPTEPPGFPHFHIFVLPFVLSFSRRQWCVCILRSSIQVLTSTNYQTLSVYFLSYIVLSSSNIN